MLLGFFENGVQNGVFDSILSDDKFRFYGDFKKDSIGHHIAR